VASLCCTPLHAAANSGQPDKVKVMIAAGADVLSSCNAGATALHLAIEKVHLPVVKLLLQHGAAAVLNTMQYTKWNGCGAISALMFCENTAIYTEASTSYWC
jgi:ankyrin repeat protein